MNSIGEIANTEFRSTFMHLVACFVLLFTAFVSSTKHRRRSKHCKRHIEYWRYWLPITHCSLSINLWGEGDCTSLHHIVKTSFLYCFIKYIKYFISKYFYSHRHGFNTEIRMNMIYIITTLYFLQILFSVTERATALYGDIQTSLMRLPSSRLFLTFDVFSDFP